MAAQTPAQRSRVETVLEMRQRAAVIHSRRREAPRTTNGDETSVQDRAACFLKGLPRTQTGAIDIAAYDAMLAAIRSRQHADFERIPDAAGRKLVDPQAAFAYHLEGGDPHTFPMQPPPAIRTQDMAVEAIELYWQALVRDVAFSDYASSPLIRDAASELEAQSSTLFRGVTPADKQGPYISQFLLKPIPFGSATIEQRWAVPEAGSDFMTATSEWSQIQYGMPPWRMATYDGVRRYIRNGRDLAEYVHYDPPFQAYLNAAYILMNMGPRSILNCNQYRSDNNPYRYSTRQEGFVTFGPAEVTDWLGRVTTAALKACWFQKWDVHRRLRPEELAGLVHATRSGARRYPVHETLLNAKAVDAVHARTGTYLLPQAYPEGSPLHPSYPSGHAVIAGACSVVLKACFDGSMLLSGCVQPNADGTALTPLEQYSPTVGEEIDKLASNVAMGRNWAGIHYRSDATAGFRLGEDVAISVLQDLACTFTEDYKGLVFNRFDGSKVQITPRGEVRES